MGGRIPRRVLNKVVFPLPFGPRRAMHSPAAIERDT
jgi:hypothetical protein